MAKFQNWSRIVTAHPSEIQTPRSVDDLVAAVNQARDEGKHIRMVGAGHSFTPTAATDGIMLSPANYRGVRKVDVENQLVTVDAGIDLTTLCEALQDHGLALINMGDIRVQTIAGAIQTGTHGTGRASGTFAAMVTELEIVLADGSVVTVNENNDPELFNCARVGLGTFGMISAVTLKVDKQFRLTAHEFPASLDECYDKFDQWTDEHDHVEFFWFPHTEGCHVKHNDRTQNPPNPPGKFAAWWEEEFLSNKVFGWANKLGRAAPGYVPVLNKIATKALSDRTYTNESWRVFTSARDVRFAEMEYNLPRASLLPALREVKALLDRRGWRISFPVEVRSIPGDDAWLSPANGRDSGYLAFHAFERTDREWFVEVEQILRSYDGRPHWGKLHTRTAADLAPAYPKWEAAMAVRDRVDPGRVFANDYTDTVLGA